MWKIVGFRAVSQSGWGVLSGWDNNPDHNVPSCYEKICGFLELPDTPRKKWVLSGIRGKSHMDMQLR